MKKLLLILMLLPMGCEKKTTIVEGAKGEAFYTIQPVQSTSTIIVVVSTPTDADSPMVSTGTARENTKKRWREKDRD